MVWASVISACLASILSCPGGFPDLPLVNHAAPILWILLKPSIKVCCLPLGGPQLDHLDAIFPGNLDLQKSEARTKKPFKGFTILQISSRRPFLIGPWVSRTGLFSSLGSSGLPTLLWVTLKASVFFHYYYYYYYFCTVILGQVNQSWFQIF